MVTGFFFTIRLSDHTQWILIDNFFRFLKKFWYFICVRPTYFAYTHFAQFLVNKKTTTVHHPELILYFFSQKKNLFVWIREKNERNSKSHRYEWQIFGCFVAVEGHSFIQSVRFHMYDPKIHQKKESIFFCIWIYKLGKYFLFVCLQEITMMDFIMGPLNANFAERVHHWWQNNNNNLSPKQHCKIRRKKILFLEEKTAASKIAKLSLMSHRSKNTKLLLFC